MLDMGFQEDMEAILSKVPDNRQTLLFSATLPSWVHKVRGYQCWVGALGTCSGWCA